MYGGFFAGKRILVTGAAGVKGTWLAMQLLKAGSQVVGIDIRQPEEDSNFIASDLLRRIEFIQGDINDLPLMQRVLDQVDGLFNLAAVTLVGVARRNPLETYRSNTLGVATVLEAMRLSTRVKYGVFVTTDKVYRPKGGELWREDDPLFASEPYPISKACCEQIIADYFRGYLQPLGKRIGVARAGNVLLGGDPYSSMRMNGAGHLHVDCFEALIDGRAPELYTPAFTRPYTYGLDILSGYMALMSRLDQESINGEAFNFGPYECEGIANGVLASKICEIWGSGLSWQSSKPRQEPFERQALSWQKAEGKLQWRPVYQIDDGLRDIAEWYRAWAAQGQRLSPGSMNTTNQQLITRHQQAAKQQDIWWAFE